ncbi:MAG TPA: metalloprotease PmbA [Steroidobacteraceae bacterium]|nr:metalloprotease PmbA [Steroidobacteraceae bacterium]HQX45859.1 metalloprotease PmbA [Steroidobacteraceae bacterium]HQX79339.1 metalloprotease PmbA [Steroidobacteraceae bacterium]HQZ80946.1 metalloprotease PmbA [Steroidobacteraceae bacterium]
MQQRVDGTRIGELQGVVAGALEEARRLGAIQAEVDANLQQGLTVNVRLGEVDTVEYQRDRGLGVTVYIGHRKGSASTADLAPAAVSATVAKACTIARYTADDPYSGLAEPGTLATNIPDLNLDHAWDIEPEDAVELARRCEAAGRAVDPRITNSEGASVSTHRGVHVYGNSLGFLAGFPSSSHTVSCALIAQAGSDMQRDYWYATARDPGELGDVGQIGRRAGERAIERLGARRLSTRRAPVLFVPEVARGVLGHMVAAIRGGNQYRRSSFLLDAAGRQILPSFIQMHERPHIPKALASSPFDSEGVATRDRELIANGVLQGYVLGSYAARKLGLKSTGNAGGVHNLLVESDREACTFEGLLARMGAGLVVTELMGQGVNGVTGDYSRGATGFWVEGGAFAFPVEEVTIAGNLRDMYLAIDAIGSDVDLRGTIRCGSILIGEMTIAGG